MSLLLLFLGGPQQSTNISPNVLYAIEVTRPILMLVQRATGQFTESTIQYSSATNTYNDGLYGGSERENLMLLTLNSIAKI